MKITITEKDGRTSLKVDGVELSGIVTEYKLTQKAAELPRLTLTLIEQEGMEIELPDGIVIAETDTSAM